MSSDVSEELVSEPVDVVVEAEDPVMVKIRMEREITSAVVAYVEAKEQFEKAREAVSKTHIAVCDLVQSGTDVVVRVSYGKHVLLSREEGAFSLRPIDVVG